MDRETIAHQSDERSAGSQGILDALATPVFAVDRKLHYIAFNAAHAAVMRRAYGAEILLGGDALTYPSIPLDGQLVIDSLDSALEGETVVTRAWVGPENDRRFYWTTHSPLVNGSEIVGVVMVSLDMTETQRREEEHQLLASIVEASDNAIITTSLSGLISTWNSGAERIYGYTAQEAKGQPWDRFVFGGEIERDRKIVEAVAKNGGVQHFEVSGVRKDGCPVELIVSVAPLRDRDGVVAGVSSISHDITRRKTAERALAAKARALEILSAVNEVVVKCEDEEELLDSVCNIVVNTGGYAGSWAGYAHFDVGKSMVPMAFSGCEPSCLGALELTWRGGAHETPGGRAFRSGKQVILRDIGSESGYACLRETAEAQSILAMAAFPLVNHDGVPFGALSVCSREPEAFGVDEVAVLAELSEDLAFGVGTLRARKQHDERGRDLETFSARLGRSLRDLTETMGRVVEIRDPYTQGHQVRVAQVSRQLAMEMHLPEDEVRGIELAALVHDIGKLAVPAEILTKPGKLTATEFELVKEHPRRGYEILEHVDFGWPVAEVALQHHERMDGSGYPEQLVGEEIPMASRVVAVADVVEAMASHRPYRPGLGVDAAVAEIVEHPEKYDSRVISACTRVHERGEFTL